MPKLLLVQVLRALAALSVAMLHAQYDAGMLAEAAGLRFTPLDTFPWAAGVDVFFVVSGFIMVHASRGLFGMPEARSAFLARRIVRVVPLYWAVTTLYLIAALLAPTLLNSAILESWAILTSYLFIPFTRPDGLVQPLYSLGWTLNYEMFFYGLFALAIVLPCRQAVIALIVGLAALVGLGAVARLPQPFGFWTNGIILEFAFGLALGLLRAEGVTLGSVARMASAALGLTLLALDLEGGTFVGPLPRALAWGGPAALLVAAATLGREGISGGLGHDGFGSKRSGSSQSWILHDLFQKVVSTFWDHALATRLGVAVGDASYALYLIHPFAIRGGRTLVERWGLAGVIDPWGFVALALLAAIIAALLVHRLFERPATEWARRRLQGSGAQRSGFGRGDAAQRQHP